jgi:conjugal transfer pilus assembly protein TraW
VKETITDGRGNVVVAAGTVINPLAIKPLTKKVYFIDAKDARQLQWVKKGIAANDKVILLGGSIFKASEVLQRHVYMDINGLYGRMKIRSLPSVVSQEGVKLKVEEVAL